MKGKITFNKSGSGSKSGKIVIPVAFLEILNINEENREVFITLENNTIIIKKQKQG